MTRDELLEALPHIGWSWRPASTKQAGEVIPQFVRLLNHRGESTGVEVTPDRLEIVGPTLWGKGAERSGSFGSVCFYLEKCRLDLMPGCVSVYCGGEDQPAFVNLYNFDKGEKCNAPRS